jgi:phasin protein
MTKHTESIPSLLDVQALFGVNSESLDYAERAYRTWCETAGDIQSRATEFLNARFANDSAAMARFGQCKTPLEVFNAQIAYAQQAFADLVDEGQKVVAYFGNMATGTMLPEPIHPAPKGSAAGKSKKSPHRVASH